MLDDLEQKIGELDVAVAKAAEKDTVAQLLQTHPGVGPVTALAFSLTLGQIERFAHSRQVVSYLGLNPSEHSSGGRQRWVVSASKVIRCYAVCWWRRDKARPAWYRS